MNFTLQQQQAIAMASARARMKDAEQPQSTREAPELSYKDKMHMVGQLMSQVGGPVGAIAPFLTDIEGDPKGAARAAVDQIPQGGTFGTSDEMIDKAVSYPVSKTLDMPYDQVYNMARDMSKEQLAKDWKEQPAVSLASQTLGGYGTGKVVGQALGPLDRLGSKGKALQNILSTEGVGASYGAGTADDGEAGTGAVTGALGATAVARGIPLIASLADKTLNGTKNAINGLSAQSPEEVQAAVDAVKSNSSQAYQKMRSVGAVLTPQASQDVLTDVSKSIAGAGKLNKTMHANTLGILQDFTDEAKNGAMDLETLDQYRQLFKEVVSKDTDIKGAVGGDGFRALKAIDAIDNSIENMSPKHLQNGSRDAIDALNLGRQEWAKSKRTQDIQSILERSDGDANVIKRNLQSFLSKEKNLRGWNTEELAQLKDAANNTGGELLLKTFGKFGFDLGGSRTPGNTALPALAAISGEAPAVAASTVARQAHKSIAQNKAQKLVDILLARGDQNKVNQLLLQSQPVSPMLNNIGSKSSLLSELLLK